VKRTVVAVAIVVPVVVAGAATAALTAWPAARLGDPGDGLARVILPGFAGTVSVEVSTSDGARVPVTLRSGTIWPARRLPQGRRVSVQVRVRRPGWAGWLVGRSDVRTFTIVTPSAHVAGRWLAPPQDRPVTVRFDRRVSVVSLGDGPRRQLALPRKIVPVGLVAHGSHTSGTIQVAAAARPWERLGAPVRVTWFVARPHPQVLVAPRADAAITPRTWLTLTFSRPVSDAFGRLRPKLSPATPGRWVLRDAHTLVFRPRGFGYGLGSVVRVTLPQPALLAGESRTKPTRFLRWRVPAGSMLRLQQLLAQLGYLPVGWHEASDPAPSLSEELAAAVSPPSGIFAWRYPHTPAELRALWQPGRLDEITRAAIMSFEETHDLPVDGLPGPLIWRALLADALAGRRHPGGYSYVFVHTSIPQTLNLWHDGRVIVRSPGNTGIPAAPTALGTWPVFEHIPVGTMSGTNPDGTHYNDPGIQYISYFHGGDAIHAFNRASFGTPQSLGCVELPLSAAAVVWPYTPIGTLVTIES